MVKILEDLKDRGLIYQATNLKGLEERLKKGKLVLYCGFDPTAPSLHIGHLLPLITLKRFALFQQNPIVLIGGGTGLIGDPSGKREERPLLEEKRVKEWSASLKQQIKKIFQDTNLVVLNNNQWLNREKLVTFLRETGKYFTVSYMLSKESVKNRLEEGLSFTEFSYMLLQANDFYQLAKKYHCELQIGGSDQWGNITAGIDLIKKRLNQEVFGLSLPLLTKEDGTKFGKTEQGTIWLDAKLTTPYQFYQFWFQTSDQEVIPYLKYFTFLSAAQIENLAQKVQSQPEKREAQRVLAFEVTQFIHGKEESQRAEKISQKLFYGEIEKLTEAELTTAFRAVPTTILRQQREILLVDLLVESGISSSKRQAREDLQSHSISMNGKICDQVNQIISPKDCLFGRYLILKKGKKNYHLVTWLKS